MKGASHAARKSIRRPSRDCLQRPGPPAPKILSRLLRWYDRHLQRRHLADLDDHMLRDIGLTREQASAECRKPFWR